MTFQPQLTYDQAMVHFVVLVILVAVVASFTRLATTDEITAEWRNKLTKRMKRIWGLNKPAKLEFFVHRMLECDRCTAVWVSPIFTIPTAAYYVYLGQIPWWAAVIGVIPVAKGISYLAFVLLNRGE